MPRKQVLRIVLIAALLLAVVVLGGASPRQHTAYSATTLRQMVTLSGRRIVESSPAAADFDGDGDKEIVVGGSDGMLYVLAYDETLGNMDWDVVWERQTATDLVNAGAPSGSSCVSDKGDIRSAPTIADLDNDGHMEIVVSLYWGDIVWPNPKRNGGVLAYRYDSGGNSSMSFSLVSGWPQPRLDKVGGGGGSSITDGCWDGFWSTPALGDLDGDGDLEVVIEGFDRHLHAWHHDGSIVNGWPIYRFVDENDTVEGTDCILRGGWSSPALGDIDGDGLPEVVVGTDTPPWNCPGNWPNAGVYRYATVWAINGDSTNVPGWPVTTNNNIQSSPALGDIDGDGQLEVVVGSGLSGDGGDGKWVYAWNGDGSNVSGSWPKMVPGDIQASPALGDLDGDGNLDIVIGCGTRESVTCNQLYAWDASGNLLPNFPVIPKALAGMPQNPVLADYDGDGNVEILVIHRPNSSAITVVNHDGSIASESLLSTNNDLASSPLVDDVDCDGNLEIVVGGGATSGGDARAGVYIWDVDGSAADALPWPMFHQNVQRTGRAPLPPKLMFADEVRVFHQEGSGDTESRYVAIGNGGEGRFDWVITHTIPSLLQVIPPSGVVTDTVQAQLVITTTSVPSGTWQSWPITVTGMVSGSHVAGSPATATLYLYVGDIERGYLPLVIQDYSP